MFPLPQDYPKYPEGKQALNAFIQQNIVYLEYEKSMGIEGTVVVRCDVDIDGTLSNFKVVFGVDGGAGLYAEALRVCQKIEKFTPCMMNGKPVAFDTHISVKFDLNNGDEMGMAMAKLSKKELKEIEKDAKDICEMINDIVELQLAGDTIKTEALSKSFEPKMVELQKKYPKGSALEKKLEEFVKPCLEEAKKRFPMVRSQVQEDEKLTSREIKRIKKDAKYMCDMILKIMDAQRSGDEVKSKSLSDEFEKQAGAFQKNYPKGGLKEKELEKLVRPCLEEAMKDALRN